MRFLIILTFLLTTSAHATDFEYLTNAYSFGGTFSTRSVLVSVIQSQIQEVGSEGEAIKQSVDAYSRTEKPSIATKYLDLKINKSIKKVEDLLLSYSPVEKDMVILVGTAAFMAKEGKISTSLIKEMNLEIPLGGKMRPDAEFDWRNLTTVTKINIGWYF